jgi:hypothetical protein
LDGCRANCGPCWPHRSQRSKSRVDGQRVTQILDPRTGRPLTHRLASVTVIDTLAVRADAFDTALMVLVMDEGIALAIKLDLAALFIERTAEGFTERATPRFEAIGPNGNNHGEWNDCSDSEVRRENREGRRGRGFVAPDGAAGHRQRTRLQALPRESIHR